MGRVLGGEMLWGHRCAQRLLETDVLVRWMRNGTVHVVLVRWMVPAWTWCREMDGGCVDDDDLLLLLLLVGKQVSRAQGTDGIKWGGGGK